MRRAALTAAMAVALMAPTASVLAGDPGVPAGTTAKGATYGDMVPGLAIDGDEATYWSGGTNYGGIQLDLPEALPIRHVEILLQQTAAASCYRSVSGYDGVDWDSEAATHSGVTADGQWLQFDWVAERSYTRLWINSDCSGDVWIGIREIRVAVPIHYDFTGFFAPVDNGVRNWVRAGSAVPVKFSLGGDRGFDIFAAGYPRYAATICDTSEPIDAIETVVAASTSGLQYDPATDQYTYVWKTPKGWSGCWQLQMMFADGSFQKADFMLR